jgi:hypothetical protein
MLFGKVKRLRLEAASYINKEKRKAIKSILKVVKLKTLESFLNNILLMPSI